MFKGTILIGSAKIYSFNKEKYPTVLISRFLVGKKNMFKIMMCNCNRYLLHQLEITYTYSFKFDNCNCSLKY